MKTISLQKLFAESLFRNSIYLMLATALMAGFGFFFWLINARLFSTEDIGLATTLISAMNLIAVLSLIGFDSAFVRFLPNTNDRNENLNTGLVLVGIAAFFFATVFVLLVPVLAPRLAFIDDHPLYAILFVIATVTSALNILTDAVFIAERKAKYTLIINAIFSMVKMFLPFACIGLGAIGIFSAAAAAQTLGLILSIGVMMYRFDYRPNIGIKIRVLTRVWKYSTASYFAGILSLLPATILPIIIIDKLGPEESAYFYITMMIANLLYVIPTATARSLFAESSNDETRHVLHIKKSVWVISILLTPAILILVILAPQILLVFGKNYSAGGAEFLRLIAISGVSVAVYAVFTSIFRVTNQLSALIISNLIYSIIVIVLGYLLSPFGLWGIGIAWLFGNTVAALSSYLLYRRNHVTVVATLERS